MRKILILFCSLIMALTGGCKIPVEEQATMPTEIPSNSTPTEENLSTYPQDEKIEAPNTDIPEITLDSSCAKAYLDAIEALIDRHGKGGTGPDPTWGNVHMIGVGIVRLIDFDGDGNYELYCAYQDEDGWWVSAQVIYGYDNGLFEITGPSGVSNPDTGVSPASIFLHKAGLTYLMQIYENTIGYYYALQNGEMFPVLSYYLPWDAEEPCTLNGEVSTRKEVESAIKKMEEGGVVEYIDIYYDFHEVDRTEKLIASIRAQANQDS